MRRAVESVLLFFLCIVAGPATSFGQISTWTNPSGGFWGTSANWSTGVPSGAGIAQFDNTVPGSYTVTFTSSPSVSQLRVYDGNVTFNLLGQTLNSGLSTIGDQIGYSGRLTVTNGSVHSTGLDIASSNASTGVLTIGSGGSWDCANVSSFIGSSGAGTININSGGALTTNSLILASSLNSTAVLNLSGSNSTLSTTGLFVGNSGTATATFSSGSTATTTGGTIFIANGGGSTGTLTVTGVGTTYSATTSLVNMGAALDTQATLNISSGGTMSINAIIVASLAGSNATVNVTGANSTLNSNGQITIGSNGTGSMSVLSGGTVSTGLIFIVGNSAGSQGTVTLAGAGSSISAGTSVIIGSNGTGSLTMDNGTTLTAGTSTTISATSTLTMNGGTLDTVAFTRNGTFNFNDGTLRVRGIYTPNPAAASLVINGIDDASLPTLRLSGNFAVNNVTNLIVGNTRQGALILDSGRTLSLPAQTIAIGASPGSNGQITLTGAGTTLIAGSSLDVGGSGGVAGGVGSLTINAGSTLQTNTLNLFPQGSIHLNGGTLLFTAFNPNGGSINFTAGNMILNTLNNSLSSTQLDSLLGLGHTVGLGKSLTTANNLTLNGPMAVTGGTVSALNFTNNSTLIVSDGTLTGVSTLVNNAGKLLTISGTGSVSSVGTMTNNGTLQLNDNQVATSGGTLTSNGTIRGTGYIGTTFVNGTLGQVQLTTGNRLEFQGAANTNNGLLSLTGGELVFTGPITNGASTGILSGRDAIFRSGGMTNNGSIAVTAGQMDIYGKITNNVGGRITISAGAIATFWDDVTIAPGATSVQASAAGGFVSRAVFYGSYNGGVTGGGAAFVEGDHRPGNSPGLVSFDGDLFYGGLSMLHMEIAGPARGTEYDSVDLLGGNISIHGGLEVRLLNGYMPQLGDSFLLVNNRGSNPVDGYFTALPEGSTVFSNGSPFTITYHGGDGNDIMLVAVPEPTTWAMMGLSLLGGAAWYWRYQRSMKRACEADVPVAW